MCLCRRGRLCAIRAATPGRRWWSRDYGPARCSARYPFSATPRPPRGRSPTRIPRYVFLIAATSTQSSRARPPFGCRSISRLPFNWPVEWLPEFCVPRIKAHQALTANSWNLQFLYREPEDRQPAECTRPRNTRQCRGSSPDLPPVTSTWKSVASAKAVIFAGSRLDESAWPGRAVDHLQIRGLGVRSF